MHDISVTRTFAAAHALRLYDGSVEPMHRHHWTVEVTVGARKLDRIGVVMDFHRLEGLVDAVLAPLAGRTLNDVPPFRLAAARRAKTRAAHEGMNPGVNPTAECVAWWLGRQVARGLPRGVKLVSVRVGEAPGCFATYRP